MSGSKSNFLQNKVLNHVLGSCTYTAPSTVYIGLHTGASALNSAGNLSTEVSTSSTSYSRLAVDNSTSGNWTVSTSGVKSNSSTLTFPAATADWTTTSTGGWVTHAGIYDCATAGAGNLLFWSELALAKPVTCGDTLKIAAGAILITEN
tara:strand:+ start:251 stop:697 length:447 start_codon:yes stop_codon:yes gene_type:complete